MNILTLHDPENIFNISEQGKERFLNSIQANIISSHGRKFARFIFVTFFQNKEQSSLEWLSEFDLSSEWFQLQSKKDFLRKEKKSEKSSIKNIYLTHAGYEFLRIKKEFIPTDLKFMNGMHNSELNDPPRDEWEEWAREDCHALMALASDNEDVLEKLVEDIAKELKGMAVLKIEEGHTFKNKFGKTAEHFGYADGISQPVFYEKEGVLSRDLTSLDSVLVKEHGTTVDAFGSYMVFRKLEQNVKKFKESEEKLNQFLNSINQEDEIESGQKKHKDIAGGLIFGRMESGSPVFLEDAEENHDVNDFDFSFDPKGTQCPFHAHIRKTNPRGDKVRENLLSKAGEKAVRIARRGITYGQRDFEKEKVTGEFPEENVGLLFISFQQDIKAQFEIMQNIWANNNIDETLKINNSFNNHDPIIGQIGSEKPQPFPWYKIDGSVGTFSLPSFVKMKGGGYFFAPSISFVKNIKEKSEIIS